MFATKGRLITISMAFAMLPGLLVAQGSRPKTYQNRDFYDASGKFNPEAAKSAYLAFMKQNGYPVSENLRENMWVSDFGLGNFVEVGMAGMFWVRNQVDNYSALEMIMLPGQMVPQHQHLKTPIAAPKMESWHVRYGSIYTYGEGTPTSPMKAKIPALEAPYVTVKHEKILNVGEVTGITKAYQLHWMEAGSEGAIITEYSTFHDGNAVKFTDPHIKF